MQFRNNAPGVKVLLSWSYKLQVLINKVIIFPHNECSSAVFLKLWSTDHKWSSGSALVVLLD